MEGHLHKLPYDNGLSVHHTTWRADFACNNPFHAVWPLQCKFVSQLVLSREGGGKKEKWPVTVSLSRYGQCHGPEIAAQT